ncbi:hypothetical protein DRO22_03230 [Candidatus Bathyarchaeota archaeon]|nr:MAG: hypothetical protein DRO22_03230 [Candidatus Bathyarchaeota archaeon]
MVPIWKNSNKTYIWLFNTGRGLSVCIRLPNNVGILYDLGCKDDFSPVEFIEKEILPHLSKYNKSYNPGQLLISHPHGDHIQEAKKINESDNYNPGLITLPHDKEVEGQENEQIDFSRIENEDNKKLIDEYKKLYEKRTPPLQTLDRNNCPATKEDVVYGLYYMRPPEVDKVYPSEDQKYGNGVSLCFYLRHNHHSIWICGDITPDIHDDILIGEKSIEKRFTYFKNEPANTPADFNSKTSSQPTPEELFNKHGLTLLVAPHHGLESSFCQSLFDAIPGGKTQLNIISEKRHLRENEGQVDKRYSDPDHSRGMYVNIDRIQDLRRMVSTRNGHHMLFILGRDSPRPKAFLRKNPYDLLNLT